MKNNSFPWTSVSPTRVYLVSTRIDRYFSGASIGKRVGYVGGRVAVAKGVGKPDEAVALGDGLGVVLGILDGNGEGKVSVGAGKVGLGTKVTPFSLVGGFGLLHAEMAITNMSSKTTIFSCMINLSHPHMDTPNPTSTLTDGQTMVSVTHTPYRRRSTLAASHPLPCPTVSASQNMERALTAAKEKRSITAALARGTKKILHQRNAKPNRSQRAHHEIPHPKPYLHRERHTFVNWEESTA